MIKILILLTALMATACGMQGALYLPDEGPDAGSKDRADKSSADIALHNNRLQKT